MNKSEIDKFGIIIKSGDYEYIKSSNNIYSQHVTFARKYGDLKITCSSKLVQIPDMLGAITEENIKQYYDKIMEFSKYKFTFETLMSSQLYWLDMKVDTINDTSLSNNEIISVLRENTYINTTKNETPSFDKNKGFETSLLVKSSTKTVHDSICVYAKYVEMNATKNIYPEYYNNFSEDSFIKISKTLRFERRLQSKKDIIKAFDLGTKVTLTDIFNSSKNVVADKIQNFYIREKTIKKETNKTNRCSMTVSKYLKLCGIKAILSRCGNNLRSFKNHLRRECSLKKSQKLYNVTNDAKKILDNIAKLNNMDEEVQMFLERNFGG